MDPLSQQGGGGANRHFPKLKMWIEQYAPPGVDDLKAVHVFMDCENREAIEGLRNEVRAVAAGHFRADTLDKIVGRGRSTKYGSYEAWAKLMLLWMASHKG